MIPHSLIVDVLHGTCGFELDRAEDAASRIISANFNQVNNRDVPPAVQLLAAISVIEEWIRKDNRSRGVNLGHYYAQTFGGGKTKRHLSPGNHRRLCDAIIRLARELVSEPGGTNTGGLARSTPGS